MTTIYPCVPGHEIVGRVTRVGPRVTKFKPGDLGAVGCMVDSCRTCPSCQAGLEQYCLSFPTFTYNGPDKHLGGHTFGGIFHEHRRGRGLRAARAGRTGSGRHRAAAVRRHHDLLAAAPLEGWSRPEGGHRRARRPGTHGGEVRPRLRRARRPVHDLARQGRRWPAAGRARGGRVQGCRRDEASSKAASTSSSMRFPPSTTSMPT